LTLLETFKLQAWSFKKGLKAKQIYFALLRDTPKTNNNEK
jgi:hypothetical protein